MSDPELGQGPTKTGASTGAGGGAPAGGTAVTLVIGHRGTGKSAFLRRVSEYFHKLPSSAAAGIVYLDLDHEIERRGGRSIHEIFKESGENGFRKVEAETFEALLREAREAGSTLFLSLGAGFQAPIPPEARRVWLRRITDPKGRVFLDRPRLDSGLSPFEEFLKRFPAREKRYAELASETWIQTEGFDYPNSMEEAYALSILNPVISEARGVELGSSAALSLLPADFREIGGGFESWINRRLGWSGCRFEIRDDLLSEAQQRLAWQKIPGQRIIFSFRQSIGQDADARNRLKKTIEEVHSQGAAWDWPLELGPIPKGYVPSILSLHERMPGESVAQSALRIENEANVALAHSHAARPILKLAVEARSFSELAEGHDWAARDPSQRAFLPRSAPESPGRWTWYRAWTLDLTPLSFVREGDGTSLDQPTLMEWLRMRTSKRVLDLSGGFTPIFAAILGDPVSHSRTPAEQYRFFAARDIPILAINVSEAEWEAGAPEVLRALGLRYAAVTSPLKQKAFELCDPRMRDDMGLGAINTLYVSRSGAWRGRNTDLAGFEKLLPPDATGVAVWGGGGTLEVIRRVAPQAVFYSVRTGKPREPAASGEEAGAGSPRTVVWAVGRGRGGSEVSWPPSEWKPEKVVDLNYGEDSPGREYALMTGARYVSGLTMFTEQAAEQRKYWEEQESHDLS